MASRKAESGAGRLACDAKAREFLERLVAKYSKAGVAEFVHRMDELATKRIYNEAGRKKPGIRCGPTQPYSEAFLRVEQARALLVREGRRPTIRAAAKLAAKEFGDPDIYNAYRRAKERKLRHHKDRRKLMADIRQELEAMPTPPWRSKLPRK